MHSQNNLFNYTNFYKLFINFPTYTLDCITYIKQVIEQIKVDYILNNNFFISNNFKLDCFKSILSIVESIFKLNLNLDIQELLLSIYSLFFEISESLFDLIQPVINSLVEICPNILIDKSNILKNILFEILKKNLLNGNIPINNNNIINYENINNNNFKLASGVYQARFLPYIYYTIYINNQAIYFLVDIFKVENTFINNYIYNRLFNCLTIQNYLSIEYFITLISICDNTCVNFIKYIINKTDIIKYTGCEKEETNITEENSFDNTDKNNNSIIDNIIFDYNINSKYNTYCQTLKNMEIDKSCKTSYASLKNYYDPYYQNLLKKYIFSFIEKYPEEASCLIVDMGKKVTIHEFYDWFYPFLKHARVCNNNNFINSCNKLFEFINKNYKQTFFYKCNCGNMKDCISININNCDEDRVYIKDGIINLMFYLIINLSSFKNFNDDKLILWSQFKGQKNIEFYDSIEVLFYNLIENNIDKQLYLSLISYFYDESYKSLYCKALVFFIDKFYINDNKLDDENKTEDINTFNKNNNILDSDTIIKAIAFMFNVLKPKSDKYVKKLPEDLRTKIQTQMDKILNES